MLGATVALGPMEPEHPHGALTSLCCVSCSSVVVVHHYQCIQSRLDQRFLLSAKFCKIHLSYRGGGLDLHFIPSIGGNLFDKCIIILCFFGFSELTLRGHNLLSLLKTKGCIW